LNSTVPNPGNYYFHLSATYGSATSSAQQSFSTIDITAPTFASSSIDSLGTTLTLHWKEIGSPPVTGTTGLMLSGLGHGSATLSNVSTTGTTTTATISRKIYSDESPTLSYASSTGNFSDANPTPHTLASFTGGQIINNSVQTYKAPASTGGSSGYSGGGGSSGYSGSGGGGSYISGNTTVTTTNDISSMTPSELIVYIQKLMAKVQSLTTQLKRVSGSGSMH
jgi:hypothetical protein